MSDFATISSQLADLQRSMGAVEEAVKGLPKLQERVGRLENWRNYILGVVAGVGALLGWQLKSHL